MDKESFENTICPILMYQYMFGVCRKTSKRISTRFTLWCRRLYSSLILIMLLVLLVAFIFVRETAQYYLVTFRTIQLIHATHLLLVDIIWNRDQFDELILKIEKMDDFFEPNFARKNLEQDKKRNLVLICILIPYHIVYAIFDVVSASNVNKDFALKVYYPFNLVATVLYDLELLLFTVILLSIIKRAEILNVFLKFNFKHKMCKSVDALFGSPQNYPNYYTNFKSELPLKRKSVHHISEFYIHLLDLCHHLNKVFEFQFFTSLSLVFGGMILDLDSFIEASNSNNLQSTLINGLLFWPLHHILSLVGVCLVCEKMFLQIESTKSCLTSMQINEKIPTEVRHRMQLIQNMLEAGEVGQFTVLQFFNLRVALLLGFLGLLTNYSIVLIQFVYVSKVS